MFRLFLIIALLPGILTAQDSDQHQLTIYSRSQPGAVQPQIFEAQAGNPEYRVNIPGYAVVRSTRELPIDEGRSSVSFADVAAGIDPTTVRFQSLSHPDGTRVLEQNYRYDLVSTARILQRYVDREITVEQSLGGALKSHRGRLLSADGAHLVLSQDDGGFISLAGPHQNILFPDLPDGLITRPTLVWLIDAEQGGDHRVEVSYETRGMTWWADYNLVLDESDGCRLDVASWVSIVNQSGGSFPQARLKLIAGEVNRAPQAQIRRRAPVPARTMAMEDSGFSEKSFFEYHLYTLGRKADLPDRSVKQLELFPSAHAIGCSKQLLVSAGYNGWFSSEEPYTQRQQPFGGNEDVQVSLSFENSRKNELGVPLPAGRIRVSQRDPADDSLEFIGEDIIDHTPRNETVNVRLGNAFDVVAERRQADFSWNNAERWMEEIIEVELRNRKQQAVTITVRESLYRWTNWRIENASHEFEKRDANSVEFEMDIDAEETTMLRYTARYTW